MNILEIKKREILEKVNKNDFNFTEDELYIIKENEELAIHVIEKLVQNEKAIETSNIIKLILSSDTLFGNFESDFNRIIRNQKKNIKKIAMHLIRNPYAFDSITASIIKQSPKWYDLTHEELTRIYTFLIRDLSTLRHMEYYDYDITKNIKFIKEFIIPYNRLDMLNDLLKNNPESIINEELVSYLENKHQNTKQNSTLFETISNFFKRKPKQNIDLIDAIILFLNDKHEYFDLIINNINLSNNFNIENSLLLWSKIIERLNTQTREILYKTAMEKGVVEFIFIPNSEYFEFLKKNNLLERFDSIYKSKSHTTSMFIKNINYSNTPIFEKEDITWLLEHGYFDYLLSFYRNKMVLDYLLNYVKNNESKFKNYIMPVVDNLNLIKALLKARFNDTSDTINLVNLFNLLYNGKNLNDVLREIDFISSKIKFDKESLNELFSKHTRLIEEFFDHLNFKNIIILNNDILKLYASFEDTYTEKILNIVLRSESYSFFYNHETYLTLRNYLSRKYNVTLENLDLIENTFGVDIIKYLDNEYVQEFLKLPNKELNKLINLLKTFYNGENLNKVIKLYEFICDVTDKKANFNVSNLNEFFTSNPVLIDMLMYYYIDTIIANHEVLKYYISLGDKYIEKILDRVLNEEISTFYSHEVYLQLRNYLSKKYNVTLENLDLIENAFGPLIIKYINNETIQNILKLPNEELTNIIKIFPNVTYTMRDAETLYDTVKQFEYSKVKSSEASLFTYFKEALQNKNEKTLNELIDKLTEYLTNSDFIKRFPKYKDINFDIYLKELCAKFDGNGEEVLTELKSIIDAYLTISREEYRKTYDIIKECGIREVIETKSNEKAICIGIINSLNDLNIIYLLNKIEKRVQEEYKKEHGSEHNLDFEILDLLKFYVYGIDAPNINSIKQCIKYLVKIIKEIDDQTKEKLIRKTIEISNEISKNGKEQYMYHGLIIEDEEEIRKAKRTIDIAKNIKVLHIVESSEDIYRILTGLNINALRNNVLNNDEIYKSLLQVMEKYKLHKMPLSFQSLLSSKSVNMGDVLPNLGEYISHYYLSYINHQNKLNLEGEKKNTSLPLITILKDANVYGASSDAYSIVLTSVDARLIKANPGQLAALHKTEGNQRLEEAVTYTLCCFERDKVCIPTFNEEVPFTDKKLRVVVGNFTNPCNVTHGERTDACMRIGGHAESLFDFALKNPHGFHIRFEDAETHEYVSRVTGFRNGNTVFLNELRHSLVPKFRDDDLFLACKKIGERLIEKSKTSTYPIDNVLLVPQYAAETYSFVNIDGPVTQGLGSFYTDYSGKAIIVATTSKVQNVMTPINFDNNGEIYYPPARDEVREVIDLIEITSIVNRINGIKKLKSDTPLSDLDRIYINDFVYGIVNNDFYIYVNAKGEIKYDIIMGDERALIELEDARAKVIEKAKKLGIEVLSL